MCARADGRSEHVAIGTEWLLVSAGAGAVYVNNYVRARHAGGSQETLSLLRALSGTVFYVALIAGCIILLFGATAGLYIAAVAMVSLGLYSVSGAWLLLVSAHVAERGRGR